VLWNPAEAYGSGMLFADGTSIRFNAGIHVDMIDNNPDDSVMAFRVLHDGSLTGIGTAGKFYIDGENEEVVVNDYRFISGDGGTTNYCEIKADGEIALHGTARVKKTLWLPFETLKASGTKPATYIDHGIAGAWEFSDATDDTIVFLAEIPSDMDRSEALTMKLGWSTDTTVTTETAVWQLEYLWIAPGDDTTAAAQETLTIQSNAIAQANGLIIAEFTGVDLPSANDVCVHCRLKRLGADGNDDLTDTTELHGVCFEYTSDKLGEAT